MKAKNLFILISVWYLSRCRRITMILMKNAIFWPKTPNINLLHLQYNLGTVDVQNIFSAGLPNNTWKLLFRFFESMIIITNNNIWSMEETSIIYVLFSKNQHSIQWINWQPLKAVEVLIWTVLCRNSGIFLF